MLTPINIVCRLSDMGYKIYYDILGAAAYAGVTRHTIYHW
ncbi:unnamed protein product, partial [marine sediment metagenome]